MEDFLSTNSESYSNCPSFPNGWHSFPRYIPSLEASGPCIACSLHQTKAICSPSSNNLLWPQAIPKFIIFDCKTQAWSYGEYYRLCKCPCELLESTWMASPKAIFKEAEHLVFMRGKGGAVFLGIPSDKDRYLYVALALLLRSQPKQFFIFSGFPAVE